MASFTCGMFPSCSTIPVLSAKPISVPMVSKMLIRSREKTTSTVLSVNRPVKSNLQKTGLMSWGIETGNQLSGITVTPIGMPMTVVMMMLRNSEPLTFFAMRTPLSRMATIPSMQVGVKAPNPTNVASFATMIPAFFRPMNAMNIPIPADMA